MALLSAAALSASAVWVLIVLLAVPVAAVPVKIVRSGATGMDLIPVLGATGRLQLVVGALVTGGFFLS